MIRRMARDVWVKVGVGFSRTGGTVGVVIRDGAGGGVIPLGK
jgi:hypothetical protein